MSPLFLVNRLDPRLYWCIAAVLFFAASSARAEPNRYALLVGCTKYPEAKSSCPELYGPANDVPLWARVLTDDKTFHVPKDNVTMLVGWGDDAAKRPTHDNIVREFEQLIARAKADDQIAIVMIGHGSQIPIPESQTDPLDPKNPEPDGLDEVFLPADIQIKDGKLRNYIIDDLVGEWLDKFRAKGAHVWIVFDCCHSGTMTRGGPGGTPPREISRGVQPLKLGIDPDALQKACERGKKAVEAAVKAGKPLPGGDVVGTPKPDAKGSVVAFYAAQPFEEAPELPQPEDAPADPKYYYGLLSYTMLSAIQQRQNPLTYRELMQIVAARYRAERFSRPPTPFAEGDLDREVLGMAVWPGRADVILERRPTGELQLNAGVLRGLSKGSILAVHPAAGATGSPTDVLGYVRVTSADLASAQVEPASLDDKPAIAADKLPNLGRCSMAAQDLGDLRVKVAFDAKDSSIQAAWQKLPANVARLIAKTEEEKADWVLRRTSAKEMMERYGLTEVDGRKIDGDRVLLLPGTDRWVDRDAEKAAGELLRAQGRSAPRKIYGFYAADADGLGKSLQRDLPKMFSWENLWKLGDVSSPGGSTSVKPGVVLDVHCFESPTDKSPGRRLTDPIVTPGQVLEYRIRNGGQDDYWVCVLMLDANLGITVRPGLDGVLRRGEEWPPKRDQITADGGAFGPEGMILLAVPMNNRTKQKPDFAFLEQPPLQILESKQRSRAGAPKSALGQMLADLSMGNDHMRGTRSLDPEAEPVVVYRSWVTSARGRPTAPR